LISTIGFERQPMVTFH